MPALGGIFRDRFRQRRVEEAKSAIIVGWRVRSASGARVDGDKSVSGNIMRLNVGSLSPGSYSVTWRVLSVDTHTTQGSFSFYVGR